MKKMKSLAMLLAVIMIVMLQGVNAQEDASLIGHWKLDEAAGSASVSNSTDVVWGSNTVGSDVTAGVSGMIGTGFLFNKVNNLKNPGNIINLGAVPAELVGKNEITVSTWVKPKGYTYYQTIFSILDSSGNVTAALQFENSKLQFLATVSRYKTCDVVGLIPENKWSHVTLTLKMTNGSWDIKVYVNGVEAANRSGWGIYIPSIASGSSLLIGSECATDVRNSNDFKGTIDDVRLYSRRLAATEIKELYDSAPLVGAWSFDEATVSNTANGSENWEQAVIGNDVKTEVIGKFGKAFEFKKTHYLSNPNNNVSLGALPATFSGKSGDDKFTISAWVKPQGFTYYQTIFSIQKSDHSVNILQLRFANGNLQTLLHGYQITSGASLSDKQWYHIVFTIDYKNAGSLCDVSTYVNGELYTTSSNVSLGYKYLPADTKAYIGAKHDLATATEDFNGKIDKFQLFNRVYTAQEVAAMTAAYSIVETTATDNVVTMANNNNLGEDNTFTLDVTSGSLDAVGGTFTEANTISGTFENEYFAVEKIPNGLYISEIEISNSSVIFTLGGTATQVISKNETIQATVKAAATIDCDGNADEKYITIRSIYKAASRDCGVDGSNIVGGVINLDLEVGKQVKVVVGVYDSLNQLQNVKYATVTLAAINNTAWFSIPMTINEGCTAKLFIWDTLENAEPLAYITVID